MLKLAFAAGAIVMATAGAQAETRPDTLGAQAITRGDFSEAEAKLNAERRVYRDRPEILLNLAAVYARTGRAAEARTLYRDVLAHRDVLMDLRNDSTVGAHAIASRGLTMLDRPDNRMAHN